MRVGPFPVAHYDPVGNRTQQTSTVPAISSGSFGYDADDRLSGDVYDPNGNTVNSGGIANVYDFENHLVQQGGATMVYDAPFASRRGSRDGNCNRVAKTVAGITTKFLPRPRFCKPGLLLLSLHPRRPNRSPATHSVGRILRYRSSACTLSWPFGQSALAPLVHTIGQRAGSLPRARNCHRPIIVAGCKSHLYLFLDLRPAALDPRTLLTCPRNMQERPTAASEAGLRCRSGGDPRRGIGVPLALPLKPAGAASADQLLFDN